MAKARSLRAIETGALLEITRLDQKEGEYGPYALATFATTLANGSRINGVVRLNQNIMAHGDMKASCVFKYDGLKVGGKKKQAYHDFSMMAAPTLEAKKLREFADGLRKLAPSALNSLMKAAQLTSLPANTVVVFKNVQRRKLRKEGDDTVTVAYEAVVDGEERTGTLIVPARYEERMRELGAGIFIYERMRRSQIGRECHDLNILNESAIDCL